MCGVCVVCYVCVRECVCVLCVCVLCVCVNHVEVAAVARFVGGLVVEGCEGWRLELRHGIGLAERALARG